MIPESKGESDSKEEKMKVFKMFFGQYHNSTEVNTLAEIVKECFFNKKELRRETRNFLRPPKGYVYITEDLMEDLYYIIEQILPPYRHGAFQVGIDRRDLEEFGPVFLDPKWWINRSQAFFENAIYYYELTCGYEEGAVGKSFGNLEVFKNISYEVARKIMDDKRAALEIEYF